MKLTEQDSTEFKRFRQSLKKKPKYERGTELLDKAQTKVWQSFQYGCFGDPSQNFSLFNIWQNLKASQGIQKPWITVV